MIVIDSYAPNKNQDDILMPNIMQQPGFKQYKRLLSEAPYTEGAQKSLLSGVSTLDDSNYLCWVENSPSNIFKYFHQQGYYTKAYFGPEMFNSQATLAAIDEKIYTNSFPLRYYQERYNYFAQKKKISLIEEKMLLQMTTYFFDAYLEFLTNPEHSCLISEYLNLAVFPQLLKEIRQEYQLFNDKPKKYLAHLLNGGKNNLFIDHFSLNDKMVTASFKQLSLVNSKRFKKFKIANFKQNFWGINLNFKQTNFSWPKIKNHLYFYKYYTFSGSHFLIDEQPKLHKNMLSAYTTINHFCKNWKNEKPTFTYIHLNDVHVNPTFMSFDQSNQELFDQELKETEKCLKQIKSNNLVGDLALLFSKNYVDRQLKKIFDLIDENTLVYITSDHGNPYSSNITRSSFPNNFYLDNYQIPLHIIDLAKKDITFIENYGTSKDILATIIQQANLPIEEKFTGSSLCTDNKEYCLIEYLGGGCPDIVNHEIFFGCLIADFLVCFKVNLFDELGYQHLKECYDLSKDPKQLHVYLMKQDNPIYLKAFQIVQNRLKEVRDNYEKY